jgi:hypothetical protein
MLFASRTVRRETIYVWERHKVFHEFSIASKVVAELGRCRDEHSWDRIDENVIESDENADEAIR